jgi:ABC-type multidrug transport system fused ATPase/permease subunit
MRSTPSTPVYTPSTTTCTSDRNNSPTPPSESEDQYDPDTPLPSVESDTPSTPARPSIPGRTPSTSSHTSGAESAHPASDQDRTFEEIEHFQSLRIASPRSPISSTPARDSRTPSIQVTPSASSGEIYQTRASRTDSLVADISALQLDPSQERSLTPTKLRESIPPSQSRQRRSRSGSAAPRERHEVEKEAPPEAFSHMTDVQEALSSARTVASRISDVLASSNLHRENGSSIHSLHRQAKKLVDFQLPSSRIVGLVGDSGVGKSSLINSLLDRADLARAVSDP